MAIAFRESAEGHATTGSVSITIPASVQAGDLLILVAGLNNGGNAAYDWSTPAGWTKRDDRSVGSNLYAAVYVKTAVSGDASSVLTLSSATTGKSCAIVAAYSGTDSSAPIDVFPAGIGETTSTVSHTTPTVTTTQDQDWVIIACVQTDSATNTWSTTTGYTKRQDSIDNSSVNGHVTGTLQDKGPEAVGTYGGEAITATAATIKAAMWTIAISPQQTTQTSRPVSDVSASGTVGVPTPGAGSGIYADLAANVDTSYAEISNGGSVEVGLNTLIDPQTGSGHVVSYRIEYGGGATNGSITATLKQGSTTIASWTDSLTNAFAGVSHTLTSTQANAITDYSALSLLFSSSVS